MDFTSQYCPQRKHLEEWSWNLVSRLAVLTERLMKLVGKNHREFIAAKDECAGVRLEILESYHQILAHRSAHGC